MTEPGRSEGLGFSFPIAIPLLVDPVLLVVMVIGRKHSWVYAVHAVYLGLVGVFLWMAVSRAQFEKIQARAPRLTRANWVFSWIFFFVALPLLLWLFFGLVPLIKMRG